MVALPTNELINNMYEAAASYTRGKPRHYLGMSQIGKHCGRCLWYGFRGFTQSSLSGKAAMIFSMGDRVEDEVIKWLTEAGYTITDRQLEFTYINGFFKGHWDGRIVGVTSKPHVLEIKSANSKRFAAYAARGIKSLSPEYYCQIQCYMGLSGLERGLFVVMNKDNCDLYQERVRFNKYDFDAIIRRATNIIYANEAPPKTETLFCEYCGFKSLCSTGKYIQSDCTCGTCVHLQAKEQKLICTRWDHALEAKDWGLSCSEWKYVYGD